MFNDSRARIVTLHEGHSERKIAVKMACSKTAVHTTINNFELYGNYSDKKKSGRVNTLLIPVAT